MAAIGEEKIGITSVLSYERMSAENKRMVAPACMTCTNLLLKDAMKCAGCKAVYYCNRTCQAAHWPKHKLVCKDYSRIKQQSIPKMFMDMACLDKITGQAIDLWSNENLGFGFFLIKKDPQDITDFKQMEKVWIPYNTPMFNKLTEAPPLDRIREEIEAWIKEPKRKFNLCIAVYDSAMVGFRIAQQQIILPEDYKTPRYPGANPGAA